LEIISTETINKKYNPPGRQKHRTNQTHMVEVQITRIQRIATEIPIPNTYSFPNRIYIPNQKKRNYNLSGDEERSQYQTHLLFQTASTSPIRKKETITSAGMKRARLRKKPWRYRCENI
jgi:hypothetical protein